MNDQRLSELLQKPAVPESLALRLHENWEQQRGRRPSRPPPRWLQRLSLAAGVAVAALLAAFYLHTPSIVNAAYADVQKDAALETGFTAETRAWLAAHDIRPPPRNMPVQLSKFCSLGKQRSTHLRIAGSTRGTMHLFLYTGEPPAVWGHDAGRLHDMHWRILSLRGDLNLLILYTDDMRTEGVNTVLNTMLPDMTTAS